MIKSKEAIQTNMLKYAKNVVLLSDDVSSDNVFHILSVIKSSLKRLEKDIYTSKYRTEDLN